MPGHIPVVKLCATGFDPKCPAMLLVPQAHCGGANVGVDDNNNNNNNNNVRVMNRVLDHVGVGCNDHELAALRKILDSHDVYFQVDRSNEVLKGIFLRYRMAVLDCLADWRREVRAETINVNLELLAGVYSVMHLSDVFLPLSPSPANTSPFSNPFDAPGAITADMVRYLRFNHLHHYGVDMNEVVEMMRSAQPDQYGGGTLYWDYLKQLVLCGCLEMAWNILERHSLFVAAQAMESARNEKNSQYRNLSLMDDIRQQFLILKDILLFAPIPGGRTQDFDAAPQFVDQDNEEMDEFNPLFAEFDITSSDYRNWDVFPLDDLPGDYPVVYNVRTAMEKYRSWQDFVKNIRPSFALSRRLNGIDQILGILVGDFTSIQFDNWAERLCSELLYRLPEVRPYNLAGLGRRLARDFQYEHVDFMLNIMDGNAGQAIELMYLLGGASGAALPTTLMALIFDLFIEAGLLAAETNDRRNEMICDASAAILSSLSETHRDTAVHLAVRILVPYTRQKGNAPIYGSLVEHLEHYMPSSIQCARTILDICWPMVERKSVQALDGCISVVLCVCRSLFGTIHAEPAVGMLLEMIEMEMQLCSDPMFGRASRTLAHACRKASLELLRVVAEDASPRDSAPAYATAKGILSAVESSDLDVSHIRGVTDMNRIVEIIDNWNTENSGAASKYINACLEHDATLPSEIRRLLLKTTQRIQTSNEMNCRQNDYAKNMEGLNARCETLINRQFGLASHGGEWWRDGAFRALQQASLEAVKSANAAKKSHVMQRADAFSSLFSDDIIRLNEASKERLIEQMLDI